MFTVIFELNPHDEDRADAYFNYVKLLKPKLVANIEGFVDNIRYRSLTRPGWFLSVSDWRDEKALVRWRTFAAHAGVSAKGRKDIFADYHLRVGQVTSDTDVPAGYRLEEQRLDVTEVGQGTAVTLSNPFERFQAGGLEDSAARETAKALGLDTDATGLVAWLRGIQFCCEPGVTTNLRERPRDLSPAASATGKSASCVITACLIDERLRCFTPRSSESEGGPAPVRTHRGSASK
jgi:heme-degrading monooxygenase HmoA